MKNREDDLESGDASIGQMTTRRVYTGRVVSLDVDTVRFPNGVTGELEMIRHSGASAVVPVLEVPGEPTKVLLIRQYRYAAEGFLYEIPAGRLEPGETPENCAKRELQEETGYSAGRLVAMTSIYTTPGFTDEIIHLFLADNLALGKLALESDEILELKAVQISEALELIRTGEIQDGKTICALLFAALFRNIK
ncbi:MAG: NUDIX hydrolase [Gemmatimonadales bacterium]